MNPMDVLTLLFAERICWMIEDLAERLGYAVVSVRRFLRALGYYRSYSHNGKWYTLRSYPVFNKDGIWQHEGISFAKHGNLTQTIVHLINKSPAGLSAGSLAEVLHTPCHAVLRNLHKAGKTERIKISHEFIYLSRDPAIHLRQNERIKARLSEDTTQLLSAEAAVFVLVEFIHHPTLSFEDLAERLLKNRNITFSPNAIRKFFLDHDIKKRKIRSP